MAVFLIKGRMLLGQGQGEFKLSVLQLLMSLVALFAKLINDWDGLTERARWRKALVLPLVCLRIAG